MRVAEQDRGAGPKPEAVGLEAVEAEVEAIVEDVADAEGVWAGDRVAQVLERLASDFVLDNTYREQHLSLTASENYPSKLVRMLGAGLQGGFYEFAPPYPAEAGEWAFPGSGANASLVGKLTGIGRQLFEAATFDWRPNGGSVAEQAVLLGTCGRGDGFVHFAHRTAGTSRWRRWRGRPASTRTTCRWSTGPC